MNDVIDAGTAFRQRLDSVAADTEALLALLLDDAVLAEERARPKRLMDAMRHVALGGGKRLRPFLVVETGALLRFGCLAGAMLGEATPAQRAALDRYGSVLGEAFQIADDLLDVEGDAATVGKATGKDAAVGKGTFVSVLGLDQAKARLKALVGEAEDTLAPFGRDGDVLKMAAR